MSKRSDAAQFQRQLCNRRQQVQALTFGIEKCLTAAQAAPNGELILTDPDWLELMPQVKSASDALLDEIDNWEGASLSVVEQKSPIIAKLRLKGWISRYIALRCLWDRLVEQYDLSLPSFDAITSTATPESITIPLEELCKQFSTLADAPDQYCSVAEAARTLGIKTETLRRYRYDGRKTPDGYFGEDCYGRVWARSGTPHSQVKYLRETLV